MTTTSTPCAIFPADATFIRTVAAAKANSSKSRVRIFNGTKCELSINFYLSLSGRKRGGRAQDLDPGVFADLSAKVWKIFGILDRIRVKYLLSATVILLFAQIVLGGGAPRTTRNPAPGTPSRFRPAPTRYVPTRAHVRLLSPPRGARPAGSAREEARRREAFNALPQEQKDSLFRRRSTRSWRRRRFSGRGTARLARRRHAPPRFGEDAAARRGVPRRPDHGQEHRLAGLRRAQQAGLHLQQGRRHLPEQQPQGRLHAHRHGFEDGLRIRQARHARRQAILSPNPNSPRVGHLPDGHDHLQPRLEEGENQGRGHAAGRRLAGRRQREEDARQHDQHRARQVHDLRPYGPPPLLPGDDQGEGHTRQEGRSPARPTW